MPVEIVNSPHKPVEGVEIELGATSGPLGFPEGVKTAAVDRSNAETNPRLFSPPEWHPMDASIVEVRLKESLPRSMVWCVS